MFFVGTKSVFNEMPKVCYDEEDVDMHYGDATDLRNKLKPCVRYFPSLNMDSVCQVIYCLHLM